MEMGVMWFWMPERAGRGQARRKRRRARARRRRRWGQREGRGRSGAVVARAVGRGVVMGEQRLARDGMRGIR
jgi:hypothetical protein